METLDRLKGSFAALARGADPLTPYHRLYRCKLLKQHSNRRRVDVQPEDRRLPSMSNIPLRVGVPGLEVVIPPGHQLVLGWENGWPDRPFVAPLWEPGEGTKPLRLILSSVLLELGGGGLNPLLDGVVRASTPCQFTGAPHFTGGKTSLVVMAKETP